MGVGMICGCRCDAIRGAKVTYLGILLFRNATVSVSACN